MNSCMVLYHSQVVCVCGKKQGLLGSCACAVKPLLIDPRVIVLFCIENTPKSLYGVQSSRPSL